MEISGYIYISKTAIELVALGIITLSVAYAIADLTNEETNSQTNEAN